MHLKPKFAPLPPRPATNFHHVLFDSPPGNQYPRDHVLYIDGLTGEKQTHGEFYERVRDGATGMAAAKDDGGLGVRSGMVAIFAPNCIDYSVLVHSCLVLAVPFALLPSKPTNAELVYLLRKSKATKLFVYPSLLEQALQAAKETGFPVQDIVLFGQRVNKHEKYPHLDKLIENVRAKKPPRQSVVPAEKDTLAYLVFSSGTSGLPKGVMISHGNLSFCIQATLVWTMERNKVAPPAPGPSPIWLCFLPMYHSYGLHYFTFLPFLSPCTLVILPRWNIDDALAAIPKYKVNSLALVPSIVQQLATSPKTKKTDVSSVLSAGSGGAFLPPEIAKKMTEVFGSLPVVAQGYGLSEATIGSIGRPAPGQFGVQPDEMYTGILIPDQEARIVREDGSEADYDEPGELLLKGDNVALGYWGDEKATKDTFTADGWLRTGDRFRADRRGVFYYEDRLKDTLKISGAQVAPVEIELALRSHPEKLVADVVVAGVPGHGRTSDERLPRAWIVLSEAGAAVRTSHGEVEVFRRLDEWSRKQLSRYKWLKAGMEIVDEIPKSPTGKTLRRVVVDEYIRRTSTGSSKGENVMKAKL